MLRNIIVNFSRTIKNFPHQPPVRRLIITSKCFVSESTATPAEKLTTVDTDDQIPYIRPALQTKIIITREAAIEELCQKMPFGRYELERIFEEEPKLKKLRGPYFSQVINHILSYRITRDSVADNAWILQMNPYTLQGKLDTLKEMQPKDINDLIPLLRITQVSLKKVVSIIDHDTKHIQGSGNRIYYLSEKLQLEPKLISKYISRRLFMLEMPWQMFDENLNIMLEYNVDPINILNDLWAFRYAPNSIRARFERAKIAHKEKIMPWMVRCTEPILQRSLNLTIEENELLGDNNTLVDYVADRLGFSVEITNAILQKHPAVLKVRVTKIREILDYLLNEAGYTKYDIGQTPRILCHGLDTTKQRLKELNSMGCHPSSLIIVCKSKKEYDKFVNNWLETRKKIQRLNSSNSNA